MTPSSPDRLPRRRAGSIVIPLAAAVLSGSLSGCASSRPAPEPAASAASPGSASAPAASADNAELQALCDADQADRQNVSDINWHAVSARDEDRQKQVRAMLDAGSVRTARDYYNAALIYQHSMELEGIQLAHELAMVSGVMGDKRGRWLMAASYDRLLNRLSQPQRFATQYVSKGAEPMKLSEISPGVTDDMRRALNVPTLEQAIANEAKYNQMSAPK